jgi:hypothetical protein
MAANAGKVAGDVSHMDGIKRIYSHLVQVPIPVNYMELAVFSKNAALKPQHWRDLRTLSVGIVRGRPSIEKATRDLQTRAVDTYAELFALLEKSEVDVIVAQVITGLEWMQAHPKAGWTRNAIMESQLLYHYLHERWAFLIPRIEPILKSMLLDGTIMRIRQSTYQAQLRAQKTSHDQ